MHEATLDLDELSVGGAQLLHQVGVCLMWLPITAGVEVYSGVARLWPRMDREVRFLDDDDAADSLGREAVEGRCDDRRVGGERCALHGLFDVLKIV